MKFEIQSFKTKVARRIFLLFIFCAILPVITLSTISFFHVKNQLYEQSRKRLEQHSKSLAISIYERLVLLRAELKMIALHLKPFPPNPFDFRSKGFSSEFSDHFHSLAVIFDKNNKLPLFGAVTKIPPLSPDDFQHLRSGHVLLTCEFTEKDLPVLSMFLALDPSKPEQGILYAKINNLFIWEAAEGRPPLTEFCVLDQNKNFLFSTLEDFSFFPSDFLNPINQNYTSQFQWNYKGTRYFSCSFSIFLRPNFRIPKWIVVLSESEDHILTPMTSFNRFFPSIIIITLAMVFFLSIGLIKKNMDPIEALQEATHKIAEGSFGHKVNIRSGDEFETLGDSFNKMSSKLKESQDLIVRAAKLSTMGQMAAGIIHEIRQPLTAISGMIQLVILKETSDENRRNLIIAIEAVKRLNNILTKFKSFSYFSKEKEEKILLSDVIDNVLHLLDHQFRLNHIQWKIEKEDPLVLVTGDKQALHQVFTNLLINSIDAFEHKRGGSKEIRIKLFHRPGKLLVEIEDTGCGIPEEFLSRIFDPFFTTKGPEKGTGLGMAIVESILHNHKADIHVESQEGKGTKTIISFLVQQHDKTET